MYLDNVSGHKCIQTVYLYLNCVYVLSYGICVYIQVAHVPRIIHNILRYKNWRDGREGRGRRGWGVWGREEGGGMREEEVEGMEEAGGRQEKAGGRREEKRTANH